MPETDSHAHAHGACECEVCVLRLPVFLHSRVAVPLDETHLPRIVTLPFVSKALSLVNELLADSDLSEMPGGEPFWPFVRVHQVQKDLGHGYRRVLVAMNTPVQGGEAELLVFMVTTFRLVLVS